MYREDSRRLRTLLVLQPTLSIRALWIPLGTVHLCAATILLRTIHLLGLLVLSWTLSASRLVPNRWQLCAAHMWRHHALLLTILSRWPLLLARILAGPRRLLTLSLVLLLACVVLFLLLRFPFLANLFELCIRQCQYVCKLGGIGAR